MNQEFVPPTFDDAAQEPGHGVYICHIVQGEVVVTSCIGTEQLPQLGGARIVI